MPKVDFGGQASLHPKKNEVIVEIKIKTEVVVLKILIRQSLSYFFAHRINNQLL